jgi:hypothetical protein
MRNSLILFSIAGVWLALVAASFLPLLQYETRDGGTGQVSTDWPRTSHLIPPSSDTLVMFVHPLCPCTRATLNQLDRLSASSGGKLRATVLFQLPKGFGKSWVEKSLWQHASSIKGVTCVVDADQSEAKIFGAKTSGDTFVYAADGKLLFHGGITPGRGHEGDCKGYDTVLAILRGRQKDLATATRTLSFGCALFNR